MKKYIVKRASDGKVLSEWKSDFADHTHYEENWGKPEHQRELTPRIHNEDGTITEATYEAVPSEYVIEEIDCTAEVEAEKSDKEASEYLAKTDYAILKMAEAMIKGQDISALKVKYADILAQREIKRNGMSKNKGK